MDFGSEVERLDRNWGTETGTVATMDGKNSLGHNSLLKIVKFIRIQHLDVTKILV